MDSEEYKKNISKLKEQCEDIKKCAIDFDDGINAGKINQLINIIDKDSFQLIVVGEFSRGKSMLVNAILGKKLLPCSKNPTTATLNVIEDGDDVPAYIIHYYDGKEEELTEEKFLELIAPDGKGIDASDIKEFREESIKLQKISHVNIKISNWMGKNGITLIDTPGVNDVNERREQITYKFIPNADAAIIVCSSTQQLSSSEMVFIKENILKNDINKLFIASNFKDMLMDDAECEKVKRHFVENLEGIVPDNRIILVSAKDALKFKRQQNGERVKNPPSSLEETGFTELESKLYNFLINERGAIKLEKYRTMLRKHANNLAKGAVERKIKTIRLSRRDIELEIQRLRPKIEHARLNCENRLDDIQSRLKREGRDFSKEYRKLQNNLYQRAKEAVYLCESDVPEEMYAYVENAIIVPERELYVDFPERMKNKMIDIVKDSLEKIQEDFGEVGAEIDFGFDDLCVSYDSNSTQIMQNAVNQQMSLGEEATTSEILGVVGSIAGGIAGIAAMTAVGVVGIPFIHIGVAVCSSLGRTVGNFIDNSGIGGGGTTQLQRVLLAELEKRFKYPIEDNIAKFEYRYENQVNSVIKQAEEECYGKLEQVTDELNKQLEEKKISAEEKNEEYNRLVDIRNMLLAV